MLAGTSTLPLPVSPLPSGSRSSSTTPSSDASLELSFDYDFDPDGNFIRISKGSTNASSEVNSPPPLPSIHRASSESPSPAGLPANANLRRTSLSRSDSVPTVAATDSSSIPAPPTTARSFQRVTSASALTPGTRSTLVPSRKLLSSTHRATTGARPLNDEKENIVSSRHAPLPSAGRTARSLKRYASGVSTSEIPDVEAIRNSLRRFDVDDGVSGDDQGKNGVLHAGGIHAVPLSSSSSLSSSTGNRQRRSASLSQASSQDEHDRRYRQESYLQQYKSTSRPGTSLGTASSNRPRRVTHEEKVEQDRKVQHQLELEQAELERREAEYRPGTRQSPSPTNGNPSDNRSRYAAHHRRDSDTLRTAIPNGGSPTVLEHRRDSPPTRPFPSSSRHRRSPTAPEPASSDMVGAAAAKLQKTRTAEDLKTDSEFDANDAHAPVKTQSTRIVAPVQAVGARNIMVNRKVYARLDMIGKGGSSRVYKVLNNNNQMYAVKRVSLDRTDQETMSGYMNEISLLKRLEGNHRIIRLIDSEVKAGPDGSKGHLTLVMELGEIDMARLLHDQLKQPLNVVWVAYYWQQMLQAVHVIHEEKIVHSDLKPANFVVVRGQLKLIDFGIANAIANDTTNIHRESHVGTVNYMSPEAIELQEGLRRFKVGRPSDIWSLGCILYQMVYGAPPFHKLGVYQKMRAIPDPGYIIEYSENATRFESPQKSSDGSPQQTKILDQMTRKVPTVVIETIKRCLDRGPKARATIPDLLENEWLGMKETDASPPPPPRPQTPPKPELGADEAIITPLFMKQLLAYAIQLGRANPDMEFDDEFLANDGERLVAELQSLQGL